MKSAARFVMLAAGLAAGTASAGPAEDDVAAIQKKAEAFVVAWNRHDAKAMAAFWADDGDLINPWGRLAKGRAEVEKMLTGEHTGTGAFAKTSLALDSQTVRMVADGVAICDWETTLSGSPELEGKSMSERVTVVVKKAGGAWWCAAARPGTPKVFPLHKLAMERVLALLQLYVGADCGFSKPWPFFGGKRFVLWLVASNQIDRRSPKNLEILFSPGDATRSVEKAGGPKAYERVTLELLKAEEGDFSTFTSFVGRRNREKAHLITSSELVEGAPVIADLSFPDGAIVAFSNGAVKWMTREDLGIPPGQPITAGDDSPSDLLKHLSGK